MNYDGPERRSHIIPEELIDHIAEKAAERALEKVYSQVGKSVVTKLLWIVGAISLAVFAWLTHLDKIK